MMPLFCVMEKEMRGRVDGVGDLDFTADFADDGVIGGGDVQTVLKVLKGEIAIGAEYGARKKYSKMVLYPLAGDWLSDVSWSLEEFRRLGIAADFRVMLNSCKCWL